MDFFGNVAIGFLAFGLFPAKHFSKKTQPLILENRLGDKIKVILGYDTKISSII